MGYNLQLACHTCRVQCGALRGHEATTTKRFANQHPSPRHRKEARIDNGFSDPDEFPPEYRDVYDEVMAPRDEGAAP